MPSFEKRIKDNINKSVASPIWENENGTLKKIYEELEKHGYKGSNGVTKTRMIGGCPRFRSGMAEITKFDDGIYYAIDCDEFGYVILATVTPEKVEFPQYGPQIRMKKEYGEQKKDGFVKSGELPLSEVKDTVIATIEKMVREHPVMGKYADMILGDFKNILSLDAEREIQPISEEAMINATLKEDNQKKDIQIKRLQEMLSKVLEFAKNVRDSIVGKIFFKNKIAQLNLPEGELTEGDKDER